MIKAGTKLVIIEDTVKHGYPIGSIVTIIKQWQPDGGMRIDRNDLYMVEEGPSIISVITDVKKLIQRVKLYKRILL